MTRKQRKRFGIFRALILILLIVLVAIAGFIFIKDKFSLDKKEDETIKENETVNLNDVITIKCNKYDVYFDEEDKLGFNFIISEFTFETSEDTLYYDLGNMYTAEKKLLDECDYYLDKLRSLNYDISKFNLLNYQFSSKDKYVTGNVFIPFETKSHYLKVYNGEGFEFDLTKNRHNINELLYEIKTEDIKTDKYDIEVSTSYIENMFVTAETNEEFVCPYALAFELTVKNITSNNVYVENAKFIPEGASADDYYDCLNDHVNSYKMVNIINKKLANGDRYGLFFQIFENTNTRGTIMIKFSDSDNWMELKG